MESDSVKCAVARVVPDTLKRTIGYTIVFACGAQAFRPRRINQQPPNVGTLLKCARCTYASRAALSAETGEPVAWMHRKRAVPHGRPATEWLFTRDETEAEIVARYPHNELIPLYAAPAPREVSEAMVRIDDAFILAVEEEVGMGNGAWDMVKASDICRAVLKVAALSAETGTA